MATVIRNDIDATVHTDSRAVVIWRIGERYYSCAWVGTEGARVANAATSQAMCGKVWKTQAGAIRAAEKWLARF